MAPTLRRTNATVVDADEDSMEVDEPQVRIRTSDGKRFTLSKSEASCSNALRTMIESYQNAPNATEYINLPVVSQLLEKVIEWCQEHCNDNPENSSDIYLLESESRELWEKTFLNSMTEEFLFRLMHVANYLDIRSLYDACCTKMAKYWESKKVDELRKMYKIENDFSPEEERAMLLENRRLGTDN